MSTPKSNPTNAFYLHTAMGVFVLAMMAVYLFIGSIIRDRGFTALDASFFTERALQAFEGGGMFSGWMLTFPFVPYQPVLLFFPFAGEFAAVMASSFGMIALAVLVYVLLQKSEAGKLYQAIAMFLFLLHPLFLFAAVSGSSWYIAAGGTLVYVWSLSEYMNKRSEKYMVLIAVAATVLLFTDLAFLPLVLLTWPIVLYARLKDAPASTDHAAPEIRKALRDTAVLPLLAFGAGLVYLLAALAMGGFSSIPIQMLSNDVLPDTALTESIGREFLTALPFLFLLVLAAYERPAIIIAASLPFISLYLGGMSTGASFSHIGVPLMAITTAVVMIPYAQFRLGMQQEATKTDDLAAPATGKKTGSDAGTQPADKASGAANDQNSSTKGIAFGKGITAITLLAAVLFSSSAGFQQMKKVTHSDLNRAYTAFLFDRETERMPETLASSDRLRGLFGPDTTAVEGDELNGDAAIDTVSSSDTADSDFSHAIAQAMQELQEDGLAPDELPDAAAQPDAIAPSQPIDSRASAQPPSPSRQPQAAEQSPVQQPTTTQQPPPAETGQSQVTQPRQPETSTSGRFAITDQGQSLPPMPWNDNERYYFEVRITTNTGAATARNFQNWVDQAGQDQVTLLPQYREGLRIRWLIGTGRYSTFRDGVTAIERERGSAENVFITLYHLTDFRVFGDAPDFNQSEPGYSIQLGQFSTLNEARDVGVSWKRVGMQDVRIEERGGRYLLLTGRYNDEDEARLLATYANQKSGQATAVVPVLTN
ncbi:MAG: SPOR domain-containing protein [Balneolales bacterium]|nr:SPOR domain-containing protein [Balneolales bacterium]